MIWRKKLAHFNERKPFIWASLPTALSIVGELNERGVIYYCGDDFNALAGVDHKAVTALECQLALKADVIFTVSDKLSAKFETGKTTLLPHGVDYNLFATPAPRALDLPVGKPIAGFYGSLSNWLDLEMLEKAADTLPHWNFVFVGDEHVDVSRLKAKANVCFLGAKPHHDLPSYLQYFDVAMLPFLDNEQIRACNPLKLREYLASGTPIVSSSFPALMPYIDHIEICEGDNLATKILIAQETKSQAATRQASVFSDSWENRAKQVIHIMEKIS